MRHDNAVRQWSILTALLTGRSFCIADLETLRVEHGVVRKTIERDLLMWERIPEFQVYSFNHHGIRFWRTDLKAKGQPFEPKFKKCKGECHRILRIDEFWKDSHSLDGRKNTCKRCMGKYLLNYQRTHREYVRAKNRRWYAKKKKEDPSFVRSRRQNRKSS